jgi:hypothetical protein
MGVVFKLPLFYFFIIFWKYFGKLLLISNCENLFKGEKELFKNLYIYGWKKRKKGGEENEKMDIMDGSNVYDDNINDSRRM